MKLFSPQGSYITTPLVTQILIFFFTFDQFRLQSIVTGLNPGWPELAGIDHLTAINTIKHEMLGVTIIYGTKVFSRIVDHHERDIVWLDVNVDGHLSGIPTLGA